MLSGLRCILCGLLVAVALAAVSAPVQAAPYAAIVMDMRDGRVMHARSADRKQHPASLTKMMTLYLAFEAVSNGQLSLNTKVRVSRKAARMTGSRLRLKAGERVTIRDLIRATAIKSANDAALALAEAIAGSEKRFAQLMTAKARQLGMASTTYKNPHGLTRSGHLTTARDQARLARHLFYDFPQYYNVFGRKSERAAGRRIYTTNRLLGSYRGIEGMKTGYTRAAGYNLVATASRGSKRVIAVVMGGKSSRWRNARVAELLNMGFKRAHTRVATRKPGRQRIQVASAPLPRAKPGTPATGLAALAEALGSSASAATAPNRVVRKVSRLAPAYSDHPRARAGSKVARASGTTAPMPASKDRWAVVAGSYTDEAGALARLASIAGRPNLPVGSSESLIDQRRAKSGKMVYDVRFNGFSKSQAAALCANLDNHCWTVSPNR